MPDSVIVSIGRGRPTDPNYLSQHDWDSFRHDVDMVAKSNLLVTFTTTGTSYSEGWGQEESYTVGFLASQTSQHVRANIAAMARTYRQDAIAVTTGSTDLVGAS